MKPVPKFLAVFLFLLLIPVFSTPVVAQPGPPGHGNNPGDPDWSPGDGPPPFAGPPENPGPPEDPGPPPGDNGNEEGNGDDDNGIPDFCSSPGAGEGPDGQAGMSSVAHLDFALVDEETGDPLEEGSWGKMMYRWIAPMFDYVFNGHELPPGVEYSLTYQPQPLPASGVICLGTGTVNNGGNLHIQDAFDIATDLPAAYDEDEDEAILALVLAEDVDCEAGEMIEWFPEDYLFGEEGMFYVHSELENGDNGDGD